MKYINRTAKKGKKLVPLMRFAKVKELQEKEIHEYTLKQKEQEDRNVKRVLEFDAGIREPLFPFEIHTVIESIKCSEPGAVALVRRTYTGGGRITEEIRQVCQIPNLGVVCYGMKIIKMKFIVKVVCINEKAHEKAKKC
jgi:hypothetical protein